MKFLSSRVFRSVLGNGFISASGFSTSALILKLFGAEDFANYVYLFAVIQILSTFLSLRLEQYISTVKGEKNEFSRSVDIIVLLTAAVSVLGPAAKVLDMLPDDVSRSFFYVTICSASVALANLAQNFLIANGDFRRLTNLRLFFALAQPAFQVSLGYSLPTRLTGC